MEDKAVRKVQGDRKHAKPKAMLSKSTFLPFNSSLPRRYYDILSALDCLPLLGCNHQLSQKQSHFKTCLQYSCPQAIRTWITTHTYTCCTPNAFAWDTGKVRRGRGEQSASHVCGHIQVPHLADVPPGHPHAQHSQVFLNTPTRGAPT